MNRKTKLVILLTLLFSPFNIRSQVKFESKDSIISYEINHKMKKLKNLRTSEFKLKYPNNWIRYGARGYVFLTPKDILKNKLNNELNFLSVNKYVLKINDSISIEEALQNHANKVRSFENNIDYSIKKIKSHSNYIYKIQYTKAYNNIPYIFKRIEYFYESKSQFKYLQYQMREELFPFYLNEAMLIINSFQAK